MSYHIGTLIGIRTPAANLERLYAIQLHHEGVNIIALQEEEEEDYPNSQVIFSVITTQQLNTYNYNSAKLFFRIKNF